MRGSWSARSLALLTTGLLWLAVGCVRSGVGAPIPTASAPPSDPCAAVGSVVARFVLPAGWDFWDVFPRAGLAPELEGVAGIEVIIYAGEVELTSVSGVPGLPRQTVVDDAVCVIMPNGDANLYYGISREGMAVPSLPAVP